MKPVLSLFLCSALALGLMSGCQTASSTAPVDDGRVSVQFENPENFSDLKDRLHASEKGQQDYMEILRRTAQEAAAPYLKEGERLSVTVTDVDLAGDFLPTAASGYDIRVVKEIYPPRINFRYTLTDASGAVIREGERQLRDPSFLYTASALNRNEELHYDRVLFRDGLRRELR